MDIALVGPAFHMKTQSNAFFIDLLKTIGNVDIYWDDCWSGRAQEWVEHFDPFAYDCVVIWQWSTLLSTVARLVTHPNVIVVPMYDDAGARARLWQHFNTTFKFICLSSHLFADVSPHTSRAISVRYFPKPLEVDQDRREAGISGFFWRRTNDVNEAIIATICRRWHFSNFTIHCPDSTEIGPSSTRCPIRTHCLSCTTWFPARMDYLAEVQRHNIFFAPRKFEGIGMAFLEAMSMGLCVVAPDTPTHNEYIQSGANGILYSSLRELDLYDFDELGFQAQHTIKQGNAAWLNDIDRLFTFITN